MEPSTNQSARIAKLNEEMDGIHFVNCLYWKRGDLATHEARAEHQRRKDRLDEIRSELDQLQLKQTN